MSRPANQTRLVATVVLDQAYTTALRILEIWQSMRIGIVQFAPEVSDCINLLISLSSQFS
jgi:hypothetical protein